MVLFFGVAFLLKYVAQRELIPLELRLAAVAAGAWRAARHGLAAAAARALRPGTAGSGRHRHPYLVKSSPRPWLYGLVPPALPWSSLNALVGLACLLAVLQEARTLATAGNHGGFLAPVLSTKAATCSCSPTTPCSTRASWPSPGSRPGANSTWSALFRTFGLATLWGVLGYRPDLFASTEPLLFFFLLYVAVSVLFALRQPP